MTELKTVKVPQLQYSDKVVDVPVVQVVVVPQVQLCSYGRRCDHAATLGLATVEVPQIQFIAGVSGHSSSQQRRVRFQHGYGGDEGFLALFCHFSRSSRSSGVERQFSEPSMVKSSLPSRAPLYNS